MASLSEAVVAKILLYVDRNMSGGLAKVRILVPVRPPSRGVGGPRRVTSCTGVASASAV